MRRYFDPDHLNETFSVGKTKKRWRGRIIADAFLACAKRTRFAPKGNGKIGDWYRRGPTRVLHIRKTKSSNLQLKHFDPFDLKLLSLLCFPLRIFAFIIVIPSNSKWSMTCDLMTINITCIPKLGFIRIFGFSRRNRGQMACNCVKWISNLTLNISLRHLKRTEDNGHSLLCWLHYWLDRLFNASCLSTDTIVFYTGNERAYNHILRLSLWLWTKKVEIAKILF